MLKIGIAVVTYNRLNCLKICLQKLNSQTFQNFDVLVVNNNSQDGTKEYLLEKERLYQIHLEDNTGPAGGFHEGIKFFAEKGGYDYIWLMDDDFFPSKTCLEMLVKDATKDSLVYPFVRLKSMKTHHKPSWSGVLIPMNIVHEVGYPRKELFFWAEDTEYLQVRIEHRHGYSAKWVPDAKGVHFTERKPNYRKPWNYYYEARNMIFVRAYLHKHSFRVRMFRITRSWTKLFMLILLKEKDKLKKLQFLMTGTMHGFQGKLGKLVEPNAK